MEACVDAEVSACAVLVRDAVAPRGVVRFAVLCS